MSTPLVLTGQLKIGGVDMSAEVTAFKVSATVDTVEVPATMTSPIHGRGGAADFSIEIGYLSNDITGALFKALWDAVDSGNKTLTFQGTTRATGVAAPAVDNPVWSGTFIVVESVLGGAAEGLSMGSATFPLAAVPTKTVA